jgi:hypothetical protein
MRGGRRQLFTSPGGAWAAARGMVSGLGYAVRRPPREILSPATQSEGAGR